MPHSLHVPVHICVCKSVNEQTASNSTAHAYACDRTTQTDLYKVHMLCVGSSLTHGWTCWHQIATDIVSKNQAARFKVLLIDRHLSPGAHRTVLRVVCWQYAVNWMCVKRTITYCRISDNTPA